MRKVLLLSLLAAVPAFAQTETIAFHARLTDARTALESKQQKLPEEQLRRAAESRVMLLDETRGARWQWLMLSWLPGKPEAEHRINAAGVAKAEKDANFTLSVVDEKTFRVRCLREECVVTVSGGKSETLANGEAATVPFDSEISVQFVTNGSQNVRRVGQS